ncbi:hypothetical protein O8C89_02810 [Aliarcobacter butzleri]|uniref:hypothetical protein n=1 Tax=Aliarcobacter butzleri TaxID=28197 RepID=UPI00263C914F|nr:hypothetical protein [Aliarcobacter butzleri]MDN5079446.1 hypothetical protein [Aliarcobacter butzleri]
MSKNICSVCNKEFEDKYFDKEQTKCILHCEKDGWNNFNNKNIFFNKYRKFLENKKLNQGILKISDIVFPDLYKEDFEKIYKDCKQITFYKCIFNQINFGDLEINSSILFEECKFNKDVDFTTTEFKYLSFHRITKAEELNFQSIKVNGEFELEDCIFDSEINFEYAKFYENVVILNTKFNNNVNLNYTTFEKLLSFKKSEFKYDLNLENTIFKSYVNFLGVEAKIANRETARIIKDSFEKQNNIIEANKFYALEMEKREKELDFKKDFFEWLVFKIHGLSSNHSQDWTLALFWIINLTFFYSYLNIQPNDKILVFKIIFSCIAISVIACMTIKIPEENKERCWLTTIPTTIVCYGFYGYLVETDWQLSEFSKNLNPFSIMRGDEPITLGTLIFKIIIAYLIYQLIISIRQNTRRK